MRQIIIKDKKIVCETTVPYPKEIIKAMKEAGYKIKEIKEENPESKGDSL